MRLTLHTWGSGPQVAALVHGFTDDAQTWWRVAPALAARGYTVTAPDLRGHGESPYTESYSLAEMAQDLTDSLPSDLDLLVGHSLGALLAPEVATSRTVRRLVLVDPPWLRVAEELAPLLPLPTTAEQVASREPAWEPRDVLAEFVSNLKMDPRITSALLAGSPPGQAIPVPTAPAGGGLVLTPQQQPLLPVTSHSVVRSQGFDLTAVPGVGHVMHRDGFTAFMEALQARSQAA